MSLPEKNSVSRSIFAIFPGQGSQHVGMAKDLYANFPIVKTVFEEASDAIRLDLKKLCFEGPETDLTLTENTQPCLLTASVAAFRVVEKEYNFIPGAVAGHSLGEYSALVAMGCLDLSIAVQWVRERGVAMQRAVPPGEGGMAAVLGLEDSVVDALCLKATAQAELKREGSNQRFGVGAMVEPANFNAPGQVVIAGSTDAVHEAMLLIKAGGDFAGGKAIPLQVSAPFHCRLMLTARERMADVFAKSTTLQRPKELPYPYVPNRTGRFNQEKDLVLELLMEQIDHPVLWKQTVKTFLDADYATAIEFGPGKVLTGLIKRIASHASKTCSVASVNDMASVKSIETVLNNLQKVNQD